MHCTFYSYSPPPVCNVCKATEKPFSFNCEACVANFEETRDPAVIFGLLRQWSESLSYVYSICRKALDLGVKPTDRDKITDMTLLHYAVLAGAFDEQAAVAAIDLLIERGASISDVVRWTNMKPIHFASILSLPRVTRRLLTSASTDLEDVTVEYFGSTSLHLASYSLDKATMQVLLSAKACPIVRNNLDMTPADVARQQAKRMDEEYPHLSKFDISSLIKELEKATAGWSATVVEGRETSTAARLAIGDRVQLKDGKTGNVRFMGQVHFAPGEWAGIELDTNSGRHNGALDGKQYFKCHPERGVFVLAQNVRKVSRSVAHRNGVKPPKGAGLWFSIENGNKKSPPNSSTTKKLNKTSSQESLAQTAALAIEVTVLAKTVNEIGIVRYVGPVGFAKGIWLGIELDKPVGQHDGRVYNKRYFSCRPNCGLFVRPSQTEHVRGQTMERKSFGEIFRDATSE